MWIMIFIDLFGEPDVVGQLPDSTYQYYRVSVQGHFDT